MSPLPIRGARLRGAPLICLAALALGGGFAVAAQKAGDTLTVTRKTTKLRNAKRTFAPAVADLAEGDRLTVDAAEGAWYGVTLERESGAIQGFIHAGDVTAKKDVRLSGQGVRETYSSSEAAAARKGFNPEVEQQHRANHPDLEAAFQKVDAIQGLVVSEQEVFGFLLEGGLVGEGGSR